MSRLNLSSWQAVSPYLDQALEMQEQERASWLAALSERNPALAADLQILLEEHRMLVEERFLEQPLLPLPGRASLAGQAIGSYTLLSPIGEGGMGAVWLAERSDGRFERKVALKFLNIALAAHGGEERFKREGKILGGLAHPHIAQLLDAGVSPAGQPFLVLEHVDGEHIDRYCDGRALDVEARVRLFLDVLAAVSHAHANLIVHRDIKPSNVLVSTDGQVKLLDFGIAKLVVDEAHQGAATALTREGASAMTPLYAAPEQVTAGLVTTATDVYALGVLLYVLLAGQHPAGPGPHSLADLIKWTVDTEPPQLSDNASLGTNAASRSTTPDKLGRLLRGDLDTIVAKALKKNPRERYMSATALGDDLRRYLSHQPIGARPDTLAYRAAKFSRRNRMAVVLATLAFAGSAAGVLGTIIQARTANRERVIAERRFNEVRQLANKLFEVDRQVRDLPGGAKTRQFLVDTSLEYLRRLATDVRSDPDLALDVGTAFMRVGRVQGVPISANLGQADNAEHNLRIAEGLIQSVLAAQPANRTAFLRSAQIAHDRMVLAQARRPDTEALPLGRKSQEWLEKYLSTGKVVEAEKDQVYIVGVNVAGWYLRNDLMDEGLRLAHRMIEFAKATNQPRHAASGQIALARALRGTGDLDGALVAIREGVKVLEPAPGETRVGIQRSFALALCTEGEVLGEDDAISMGRSREAAGQFGRAYRIATDLARLDVNESQIRFSVATYGIRLAGIVRHSDPRRALAIYDEVLRHSAEIKNNPRARRDETRALARSTYPLRQLGRSGEARRRLDAAFTRLRELKLYPAEQTNPSSEAVDTLRALAEYEAGKGDIKRGIGIYQQLLGWILASKPKPESRLSDALDLSNIYLAKSRLHRRAGQTDAASALEARRVELWRHWERKLPNNPFVLRQLTGPGK